LAICSLMAFKISFFSHPAEIIRTKMLWDGMFFLNLI
jgi:hypothetical protein